MNGKERIALGSGKLYIMEITDVAGGAIPEDSEIEKAENLLGLIQGGASVEYSAEFYEASDDLGLAKRAMMTNEEVTLKTGIMTWCGNTLAKICSTARVTDDTVTGRRTVKIGGIANQNGKIYLLRFVAIDAQEGDSRVTIKGTNKTGFTLNFTKDKETVIDTEFKSVPIDDEGTLLIYTEEIPKASA